MLFYMLINQTDLYYKICLYMHVYAEDRESILISYM